MYLKRMEMFGFKSFADKTELEFGPGIAAVIGPNGCGKSNIVDAVRWALGEQSVKALRGNRMEEIIFSGSEKRKALNFAEVSLTFAGAGVRLGLDYDEVTITRRLFRSGESEYYINKSPCRLKDITELFLDTGLGKDIYSVVGQGRVEEIINSKPEDRREIFEEAAGILKYKLRKKEARRRLEETRENLVRVQDLIFELETQVEPLRAQAAVTRRFRELKQQEQFAEKRLLTYRLLRSEAELAGVEKRLRSAAEALAEAGARAARREERLQEFKRQTQEETGLGTQLEQELNRFTREIEQRESEMRLLGERAKRLEEQQAQAGDRLKNLAALREQLAERQESLQREHNRKREAVSSEEERCRNLRLSLAELEKSSLTAEVEERQQGLFQALSRRDAVEAAQRELLPQQKRLEQRLQELLREEADLAEQQEKLEPRQAELQERRSSLQEQLAEIQSRENEAEREREAHRHDLDRLRRQEQQHREELQGINSRLQLLREQETGLSGYYRGVREILRAGPSLGGIVGPVVDLLGLDDRYIRAVETALGGGLQFIVTETEAAAKEAIRFLKESNRGWATFLPLDTIRVPPSPLDSRPGWRDLEGALGKASELVRVDPAYRKAIDYLLGQIAVCSDLDAASGIARFTGYSCRIVSLEGDVINPGGALRGGSVPRRNAGQPLGRRKEMEALEREQAALHKKRLSGKEKIADVERKLSRCEENLRSAAAGRAEMAEQLEQLQRSADSLEREEKFLAERRRGNTAALEQCRAEKDELERRLSGLQDSSRNCAEEIARFQKDLDGKKELHRRSLDEKKELETALTEALVGLNSSREQAQALAANLEKIEEEKQRLAGEHEALEREVRKYAAGLAENREAQRKISGELQQLHGKSAALMARLEEHKRGVSRTRAGMTELEEEEKRERSRLNRMEKRERRLALDQARLQADVDYQRLRFREHFHSQAPAELEPDFDPAACEQELQSLKEDVEALGEVNLGAIEELERLQERIDFLKNQQDDLRKGELSLRKILAEIDQRMEYFFSSAFASISRNIQQVYSELFNGGQVLLKLTDPDNILESGIDIIAQPPGKKLQNISLLSTGEKVLTAVALLFAILRHKPAPFYLLDEVESALDDANLSRFTTYLKRASGEAQFILITHRKRTMEEASMLYGVTMPESGVSRLVSLKLDEIAS